MNTCPCCGKIHSLTEESAHLPSEFPLMTTVPNQTAQLLIERLNQLQDEPQRQIFIIPPYGVMIDRDFVGRLVMMANMVTTEMLSLVEIEVIKRKSRAEKEKEARKRHNFTARQHSTRIPKNKKRSRCRQWW